MLRRTGAEFDGDVELVKAEVVGEKHPLDSRLAGLSACLTFSKRVLVDRHNMPSRLLHVSLCLLEQIPACPFDDILLISLSVMRNVHGRTCCVPDSGYVWVRSVHAMHQRQQPLPCEFGSRWYAQGQHIRQPIGHTATANSHARSRRYTGSQRIRQRRGHGATATATTHDQVVRRGSAHSTTKGR